MYIKEKPLRLAKEINNPVGSIHHKHSTLYSIFFGSMYHERLDVRVHMVFWKAYYYSFKYKITQNKIYLN